MAAFLLITAMLYAAELSAAALAAHRPATEGWLVVWALLFLYRAYKARPARWGPVLSGAARWMAVSLVLAGAWGALLAASGFPQPPGAAVVDALFMAATGWMLGALLGLKAAGR